MPLDLKEELYANDSVAWISTTSNRDIECLPKSISKKLSIVKDELNEWDKNSMNIKAKVIDDIKKNLVDSIKKHIIVMKDIDPMRCCESYRLSYFRVDGYSKTAILRINYVDIDAYGHGVIQESVELAKERLANEIYEDIMTKKKEKSNMFKEFMDDVRDIGGEISFEFESNMYVDDEAEITIRIPTERLPMLKVQKTKTKKNTQWIEGLPEVAKVEVYNNCVVKVTYIDGTFTKAVCSENDIFDLDVGITICAMKRLFGENGTRHYNNYISHVHDVMEKNNKKKLAENAQKMIDKDKKRKAELKKAAKKLKQKEEQIDIQKQAILRAHQEIEAAQREEGLA